MKRSERIAEEFRKIRFFDSGDRVYTVSSDGKGEWIIIDNLAVYAEICTTYLCKSFIFNYISHFSEHMDLKPCIVRFLGNGFEINVGRSYGDKIYEYENIDGILYEKTKIFKQNTEFVMKTHNGNIEFTRETV